jgi:hypothetical protein
MSARLLGALARQIVLAGCDPSEMSDELLISEHGALRLTYHVGKALRLRAEQQRSVGVPLHDLV